MNKENKGLNISAKSFVVAIAVILALMILTYLLTFMIPGGEYDRILDDSGNTIIDTQGGGLPFWKWLLSPFLVLGAEGSGALIAVLIFLLVIGGAFNALMVSGLMHYMLDKLVHRFGHVRYQLMAVLILFFMAMGSLVGSFEEVVPLVPIVVSLAIGLGWDAVTGVGMSLLAAGCGFAAGVANPFTIGVAQSLAGLPMFSGIWLRALSFVLIYLLLLRFVRSHAKNLPAGTNQTEVTETHVTDPKMDRGLLLFAVILGTGIVIVLLSGFIPALRDYTMIIVSVMFLAAGIASTLSSGMGLKNMGHAFLQGIITISPSIIMILMASSIKYTMVESHILDTILNYAVETASSMPKAGLILFIYLICLIMNFFIPSGSAKAFLLIPLIAPMSQIFGLSMQLCIVAFAFGDGFSNVFYPTNAALLISLGLADVSYGKWARYSWKFQLMNLILTSFILLFGLAVGY